MGSLFRRGAVWWIKFKSPTGSWSAQPTRARTKVEAKGLLAAIACHVGIRTEAA